LPAPKRARKKNEPAATPVQPPDERVTEDLKVAGFYQNDGNYMGAYLRAKDAVSITETDPEANFVLAEAARKLGKLDEAVKHYKRCLELDPLPKQKKSSEKALKEMTGS
jgi:tetratricopeptide (TPR) repeat protein